MVRATRAASTTTTTTWTTPRTFATTLATISRARVARRARASTLTTVTMARAASSALTMPGEIDDAKRAMRRAMRDALREMSPEAMSREDAAIARHARGVRRIRDAARCATYLASARLREASTSVLVAEALSKPASMVFVPVVDDGVRAMRMVHVEDVERDVERGAYDLSEPTASYADGRPRLDVVRDVAHVGALDVIIVPGVAFNARGVRLGRGGGYYDSFLSRYADVARANAFSPPLVVALAYSCQFIADADVPAGTHDRCVDVVITPTGAIACTPAGALALENSV